MAKVEKKGTKVLWEFWGSWDPAVPARSDPLLATIRDLHIRRHINRMFAGAGREIAFSSQRQRRFSSREQPSLAGRVRRLHEAVRV